MADGPVRVRLSRKKGWRKPPNTVVVCRPSKWGNPYPISTECSREQAVALFEKNVMCKGLEGLIRAELRGRNLACWCALDVPCHADVLLRIANSCQP